MAKKPVKSKSKTKSVVVELPNGGIFILIGGHFVSCANYLEDSSMEAFLDKLLLDSEYEPKTRN